jgi:hypothetical protein
MNILPGQVATAHASENEQVATEGELPGQVATVNTPETQQVATEGA